MQIKPLIIPLINKSTLPERVIRELDCKKIDFKDPFSLIEIEGFEDCLFISFVIEDIQDHKLLSLFPCRLGASLLSREAPDLNTIVLSGNITEWKVFLERHKSFKELVDPITGIFRKSRARKLF